jgi:hypothetical protein
MVGPNSKRVYVSTDGRTFLEKEDVATRWNVKVFHYVGNALLLENRFRDLSPDGYLLDEIIIRINIPVLLRSDNPHLERRPDARLVQAGEPPVAEERLQVRVEVHVAVSWVSELVETSTVLHILILKLDVDAVHFVRIEKAGRDLDPVILELDLGRMNSCIINDQIYHPHTLEVNEEVFLLEKGGGFEVDGDLA